MFYCEQSVRQQWSLLSDGRLQLQALSVDAETSPPWTFEPLCAGQGVGNRPFLNLVFCSGNDTGTAINHEPLRFSPLKTGQLKEKSSGLCAGLANGVAESGALLSLQPCSRADPSGDVPESQHFFLEPSTGELFSSIHSGFNLGDRNEEVNMCVTGGWPFLSAAAFVQPAPPRSADLALPRAPPLTVVVILNEADIDTHIILTDAVKASVANGEGSGGESSRQGPTTATSSAGELWFGISGRSIQTLTY